jgi:DNA/RNA-binding domain of Phe-tRNA-synthetase-like protein
MHTIAPDLTIGIADDMRARVSALFVESAIADRLSVSTDAGYLDDAVREILDRWNAVPADDLAKVSEILVYRDLSRRISGEFAVIIPAVENLVTRYVLKGKFPRINSLVDAANVASLRNMIPVGLFDLHSIAGDLMLDISDGNDEITFIGKTKSETIPAGFPVLRDENKVISIVGVRDAAQTRIVPTTTAVLTFSWGIERIPRERVRATLADCIDLCRAGRGCA